MTKLEIAAAALVVAFFAAVFVNLHFRSEDRKVRQHECTQLGGTLLTTRNGDEACVKDLRRPLT